MLIWGRVRPGSGDQVAQLQRKQGGSYVNDGSPISTNSSRLLHRHALEARASYRFIVVGCAGRRAARHQPDCEGEMSYEVTQLRSCAVLLLVAVAALVALPASALASKSQWSVFEDHTALVKSGDDVRAKTLDEIKNQLGADTLRIEVKWSEVAPEPGAKTKPDFNASDPLAYASGPAAYPGWYPYDDLVRRATNLGFGIIITITGDAPRWATEGGLGNTFETANRRVIASEYGQFAAAVAKRYSGDLPDLPPVKYFSIWNEPNHRNFIKPTKEAPKIYRDLVNAAIPQIRANAVPDAKILVGELAPVGRAPKAMGPTEFLRKWLCLNKRFKRTSSGAGLQQLQEDRGAGLRAPPLRPHRARARRRRT